MFSPITELYKTTAAYASGLDTTVLQIVWYIASSTADNYFVL